MRTDFQSTAYAAALIVTTAISATLAVYTWHRRRTSGGRYLALFMASATVWSLSDALGYLATGTAPETLFARLSYLGVATIAPLWLLFVLDYTRQSRWLRSRWLPLIWVIPALIIALAFTNEWHGLIWPGATATSVMPGAIVVYHLGPAAYVNAAYAYALILGGVAILLNASLRPHGRSSVPAKTVVLGVLISLAANVIYPTSLNPFQGLDVTPIAFTISGLLFTWAIFGQRLFDLMPAARETLLQVMSDGAIVLDGEGYVAEINPAARRILGVPERAAVRSIGRAAEQWPALAGCFGSRENAAEEIVIDAPEGKAWLDVRVSVLRETTGRPAGRLVVLQDITGRKQAEEDLRRSNEALKDEVAEKARAQEALCRSLDEKEVLLKEVHHRVKNNMQIISSLLNLQSGIPGVNASAVLRDSQDRIRSMALVHEKLYRSDDLARIDFRDYVESLTDGLYRSYFPGEGVRIVLDVADVSLDIDHAIPCGLIINELVSNSLKYAFPGGRGGEIRVNMARDGDTYTLTVSDDGVGLPPGVDCDHTPSLGLQLVNMLAGQLEGNAQLSGDGGTTFRIIFVERQRSGPAVTELTG